MRTNIFASSMTLVVVSGTSSDMVIPMLAGVANAAPDWGFVSVIVIVSGPSMKESWPIRMLIVLLISPAAKFSVPTTAVKSHLGEATPEALAHGNPLSALVA